MHCQLSEQSYNLHCISANWQIVGNYTVTRYPGTPANPPMLVSSEWGDAVGPTQWGLNPNATALVAKALEQNVSTTEQTWMRWKLYPGYDSCP